MSQLTGKQIAERGIIKNFTTEAVQQQGIDVRVSKVYTLEGTGIVPAQGKTSLPERVEIPTVNFSGNPTWTLAPGYYELDLMEGVDMPAEAAMYFKTRSSLVRCGAIIESGQFDAGFVTDKAGCFLIVHRTITIEQGARVAQAIVHTSESVDNMYDGQFQADQQRTEA